MLLSLRIDWSDMDLFGHVNNIAYFRYIQSARVNFWEQHGITADFTQTGIGPILASCKCDFKSALEYPGNVIIETNVTRIGQTSYELTHQLYNDDKVITAIATDVIVQYDFNTRKKILLTDEIRLFLQGKK